MGSLQTPNNSMKVLVATATYNEVENVGELCRQVFNALPAADLLIIDDNSPDGTGAQLERLAAEDRRVLPVHRPRKLGLGTAHQLALGYAIQHRYDALVTLDSDLSHDPRDIPRLLDSLTAQDFVIGSRYCKGGSCDYTGMRRWISVFGNSVARNLLRCPLKEFTTSFRAFRVSQIEAMGLLQLRSRGYAFFFDVVYKIYRGHFRMKEIPIHFHDRTRGKSKLTRFEIVRAIVHLFRLFLVGPSKNLRVGTGYSQSECPVCPGTIATRVYAQRGNSDLSVEAFKCTSMLHQSKPEVVRCLQCDLRYVPNQSAVESLYEEVIDTNYVQFKEARYRTFENAYQKMAPFLKGEASILEVGAYCGFFLDVLRRHGHTQVEGVEPSAWASEYARKNLGLRVHQGTFQKLQPKLKPVDAVVMWDVLEHVVDPMQTLQLANKTLTPEGRLFFSTLDAENWFPRLLGGNWPWIMDMHLFYFTTPVLREMLQKNGFRLIHSQRYSHYASVRYLVRKLVALFHLPLPEQAIALLEKCVPAQLYIPFSFGDIKLYVAEKMAPVPKQQQQLAA